MLLFLDFAAVFVLAYFEPRAQAEELLLELMAGSLALSAWESWACVTAVVGFVTRGLDI